ncbi:MAG: two-component regulator propeller domain-containing protein, partial [Saprospiraceae bacterium]
MIHRLVICVLLFGSIERNAIFSQEFITQSYNAQDGLSSSSVYSFYHDRLGYFWISTLQGLDRWDGTTFKKYGLKHGLPSVM